MSGFFDALSKGAWTFISSWVLPFLVAVSVWAFVGYPTVAHLGPFGGVASLSTTDRLLVLVAVAFVLAIVAQALSTSMYRILEGYYLPTAIERRWIAGWTAEKRTIQIELGTGTLSPMDTGRRLEALAGFPPDTEMRPTRLGNAIRSFESYGQDRFGLDTVTLWSELVAVAAEQLRADLDQARASVDFFVAMVYAALLLSTASVVTIAWSPASWPGLLVLALAAAVSMVAWYHGAVRATSWWRSEVRSLVNLGRKPLATALGLVHPTSTANEKRMWTTVAQYAAFEATGNAGDYLDEFRAPEDRSWTWVEVTDSNVRAAWPQSPGQLVVTKDDPLLRVRYAMATGLSRATTWVTEDVVGLQLTHTDGRVDVMPVARMLAAHIERSEMASHDDLRVLSVELSGDLASGVAVADPTRMVAGPSDRGEA